MPAGELDRRIQSKGLTNSGSAGALKLSLSVNAQVVRRVCSDRLHLHFLRKMRAGDHHVTLHCALLKDLVRITAVRAGVGNRRNGDANCKAQDRRFEEDRRFHEIKMLSLFSDARAANNFVQTQPGAHLSRGWPKRFRKSYGLCPTNERANANPCFASAKSGRILIASV